MAVVGGGGGGGDLTGLVQRFNACLNSCSGGQDWLVLCNFPSGLSLVPSFMPAKYLPCDYTTD